MDHHHPATIILSSSHPEQPALIVSPASRSATQDEVAIPLTVFHACLASGKQIDSTLLLALLQETGYPNVQQQHIEDIIGALIQLNILIPNEQSNTHLVSWTPLHTPLLGK